MCDIIIKNGEMLQFIPDSYKNQNMFDKAVDNHSHALSFDPDCYKTQKILQKSCQYLSFCNIICSGMLYISRNV